MGSLKACLSLKLLQQNYFFKLGNRFGKAAAQWLCCCSCCMSLDTKCCPWESGQWNHQGGMWHGAFLTHQWSTAAPMCCHAKNMGMEQHPRTRQLCTKNAPTLHQECTKFAPRTHRECTNFAPRMHQLCTKNAPTLHQECTNFAPRMRQLCTKNAPNVHQECTKCAPRMHQLCTKNAPTLHQEYTNFAPRLHQECTNFAPTLSNMEATKHENTEKNTRKNIHHKGAKNLLSLVNTKFTKEVNVLKPFFL